MKLDEVTVLQGFVSSPHEMWILVDPNFHSTSIYIYIIYNIYIYLYVIYLLGRAL